MIGNPYGGFTIFFTGFSGSGKSTTGNLLLKTLEDRLSQPVTMLDGDEIRQHLSAELGFSQRDRNMNVRRIGYVASLITKHGGIAICAPIAPYRETRREVREMVEKYGGFIEVHMATPLEECERRDVKGLYAKARSGEIIQFTGISDPYEVPTNAELSIDTSGITPEKSCEMVVDKLTQLGYVQKDD